MSLVRTHRRQSAYGIIAAATKFGKDVKVEYNDNGKIKCFTTFTPGRPSAVDTAADGAASTIEMPDDLRKLI
jgi:hypothetical protein